MHDARQLQGISLDRSQHGPPKRGASRAAGCGSRCRAHPVGLRDDLQEAVRRDLRALLEQQDVPSPVDGHEGRYGPATMLARVTFEPVSKSALDTLKITWTVRVA